MAEIDRLYGSLSNSIIEYGYEYKDASRDVICKQLSSAILEIGLVNEFPLITTKKMFTKGIVAELIWFLRGSNNIKYLVDNRVSIWDKDAYNYYKRICGEVEPGLNFDEFILSIKNDAPSSRGGYRFGDVGRNYGVQWRNWLDVSPEAIFDEAHNIYGLDQIVNLLEGLSKPNPINRRHIVTAWNPAELAETALPPCHWAFEIIPFPLFEDQRQAIAEETGVDLEFAPTYGFHLKWHQRSVDTFLGLPFNIASYAILAALIEGLTGNKAVGLIGDLSNVHFYQPHIELVKQQLENDPNEHKGCKIQFSSKVQKNFIAFRTKSINFDEFLSDLLIEDITFVDYTHFEPIKGEMLAPNT